MFFATIKMQLTAACLVVCSLFTLQSAGQDKVTGGGQVFLLELEAQRRLNGGQLDACEIVYLVGFQDYIYRQGGVTALRGSVSFMGFMESKNSPPAIVLKVSAFDIDNNKTVPAQIQMAYLSSKGKVYSGRESGSFNCENGGLCVSYNAIENMDLILGLSDGLEINFLRKGGRSDVRVPVRMPLDVDGAANQYDKCAIDLLQALQNKFGG